MHGNQLLAHDFFPLYFRLSFQYCTKSRWTQYWFRSWLGLIDSQRWSDRVSAIYRRLLKVWLWCHRNWRRSLIAWWLERYGLSNFTNSIGNKYFGPKEFVGPRIFENIIVWSIVASLEKYCIKLLSLVFVYNSEGVTSTWKQCVDDFLGFSNNYYYAWGYTPHCTTGHLLLEVISKFSPSIKLPSENRDVSHSPTLVFC